MKELTILFNKCIGILRLDICEVGIHFSPLIHPPVFIIEFLPFNGDTDLLANLDGEKELLSFAGEKDCHSSASISNLTMKTSTVGMVDASDCFRLEKQEDGDDCFERGGDGSRRGREMGGEPESKSEPELEQ
ncbi:hypothetical protein ACLOJK_027368 [Asimina triloba]